MKTRILLFLLLISSLVGCAFSSLQKGMSEKQFLAEMGQPCSRFELDKDTQVWVYSDQANGQAVYWAYFDKNKRFIQIENILAEHQKIKIIPKKHTRKDVERLLGPCAQTFDFTLMDQTAYMYRFKENYSSHNQAYWVQFDKKGVVTEIGITPDSTMDTIRVFWN